MKIVKTVCPRDCPDTCFLDVTVDKGKIVNIRGSADHPVTRGFTCARGKGDIKRVYSPERVLHPFANSGQKGRGKYDRIAWDDALDSVAHKIRQTIDRHGNQALLLYDYAGNQSFLAWHLAVRLWTALGATTTDYSLCSNSGHAGIGLHYGSSYGAPLETLLKSGLVVLWGNNARISAPHQWALVSEARKKNHTVVITIDPRKSETAKASDICLQPRPGSDVALAYGLARYLIRKGAVDETFITARTIGFQDYAEEAQRWTPGRVAKMTGLSADAVAEVGDLIARHREAVIFLIGLGLQKSRQGAETARAVSLLPALCGRPRAFRYSDAENWDVDWGYINGAKLTANKGQVVSQVTMGKQLARGDFKFIFVLGTNPAVTLPHLSLVRQGLAREDVFVVVQDTHWSETASLADVVLPAPTYLEKTDLVFSDNHPYCRLSCRAIAPLEESRSEFEVMQALAGRLKMEQQWLFEDPWHALATALPNTFKNGRLEDILAGKSLELAGRPVNEYQTSSGKLEFSASAAPAAGAGPLPEQMDLTHGHHTFLLLNSAVPAYTHSQFTDVYGPLPQIVWIHPRDAGSLDIDDGMVVGLYNDLGNVTLKAKKTEDVLPGTLWAPRPLKGLNGQPMNALTPGEAQKIGGGPVFNSVRVSIRKEPS